MTVSRQPSTYVAQIVRDCCGLATSDHIVFAAPDREPRSGDIVHCSVDGKEHIAVLRWLHGLFAETIHGDYIPIDRITIIGVALGACRPCSHVEKDP